MVTDGDRDLKAELRSPAAGQVGIPLDAVCTDCGRVAVKRVSCEDLGADPQTDPKAIDADDLHSFRHVCHRCSVVTWWNPTAVLSGLLAAEAGDDSR